jgi:hypothetical protein
VSFVRFVVTWYLSIQQFRIGVKFAQAAKTANYSNGRKKDDRGGDRLVAHYAFYAFFVVDHLFFFARLTL